MPVTLILERLRQEDCKLRGNQVERYLKIKHARLDLVAHDFDPSAWKTQAEAEGETQAEAEGSCGFEVSLFYIGSSRLAKTE